MNYYLDPRNFLTEKTIFQFLELSNSDSYTKAMVESILSDSFMNSKVSGYFYKDVAGSIMEAAKQTNESPLSIAIKILQEIGRGKNADGTYYIPNIVSGQDATYPGVYNFYNYGASDGQGNILRGLAYAGNAGWKDPKTAIVEGAKLISNTYLKVGQTTKYLFKFDVVWDESNGLYWHQYMTNVQDPNNQALMLFSTYSNNNLLNKELTFLIPVYKDMPEFVKLPSNLTGVGGDLYYISSNSDPVYYHNNFPGTTSTRIAQLRKDALVEMIQYNISNSGWSKIRIDGNAEVFMANEYLTPVNTKKDKYVVPAQPKPETPENDKNNGFKAEGSNIITEPNTTISDIKNGGYTVTSATKDGKNVLSSTTLGTGTILVTDKGTFTVVKLGDVNGDGEVDVIDLALIKRQLIGTNSLKEVYYEAAKLKGGTEEVDVIDLALIKRHLVGSSLINI